MNRPFWSFPSSPQTLCDRIEPLLSVYADGMAPPAEAQRIEAHLPECENCRAALAWMQATRTTLASRPVAVPPPDLHSRIALAIAASSPAPSLRPARVFTVRAIYATAASVTALGIALSYPLWHAPMETAANHPARPIVAATAPLAVKPHPVLKAPARRLVASNTVKPASVKHSVIARKIVPSAVTPPEHIASDLVPARPLAVPQVVKAPVHHALPMPKIASREIVPTEKHSIEKHAPLPTVKTAAPKLPDTVKVAKVTKEPTRVDIQPSRVTTDPIIQTASTRQASSSVSSDPLGFYKAHLKENEARVRSISFGSVAVPVGRTAQEAMSLPHMLGGEDHTAFISAVHGNQ